MRSLKSFSFLFSLVISLALSASALAGASGYKILHKVSLGGEAKWDYLNFDAVNRRIYLAHGNAVDVLDPSGKVLGTLPNTLGVHGALPIPEAGVGYASCGAANNVVFFDLKTLKVLGQTATGQKPDALGYDAATGCVYVCNAESDDATVIRASTGAVVATIPLGGKPEYLASDDKGVLFINLEDKDAVAVIDTHTHKLVKTWELPKGSSPCSMAFDKINREVFVGCRNKTLLVLDSRTGQVVQSLPIGDHVDATIFDSTTGTLFSSCGDGTINIIHQESASAYTVLDNIKTVPGAHTLTLNPDTHELFVPVLENKVFTLLILGQ